MWPVIVRIILRNKAILLGSLFLFTAFMVYNASKGKMAYRFASLLPNDDSSQVKYTEFKKMFGEDGDIMFIGFDDSELFQLKNFNKYFDLNNNLEKVSGVDTVLSIPKIYDLVTIDSINKLKLVSVFAKKPSSQHELDSLLTSVKNLPFYDQFLFNSSDTGNATIIAITLNKRILNSIDRIGFVDDVYGLVEQFSLETGIKAHYSGLPYIRTRTAEKVKKEMSLFIILAIVILALILYFFFRSFKSVFISLLVVTIAVICVFGSISLFGYEITLLTGLIPPLIIVIGIPNCIFLLNKYHQEYIRHGNKTKAIATTIVKIGNATFLTNLTTAIGFATFILTSSDILVEFGVIASVNILGVFLISLIVIPTFSSVLPPPKEKHIKHLEGKSMKDVVARLLRAVIGYRKTIYFATAALLIFCAVGIRNVKTTGRIVDDIPHDDPVYEDLLFFEKHFAGVMPFEILIDTKKKNGVFADNGKTLYKMKKLNKVLTRDSLFMQYFSRPLSINDAIGFVYQAHKGGDTKFFTVPPPTELKKLSKYIESAGEDKMNFSSFLDSTRQITRFSVQMANIGTTEIKMVRDSLQPKIDSIFDPSEYHVELTGVTLIFLKGTDYLINNLFISLTLAILLIAFFIAIMFRSFRMVLVTIIPNVIPLLFTAAIMGYFGITIKPSTILIFSIAFGISVDDSIHYLAKYRQALKTNNFEIGASVIEALRETGVSMIYTSVVLFFGFGIFSFSGFEGTKALGILVSITLLVALVTNIVLLPSLLLTIERRIIAQAYKDPLIEIYNEEGDIELDDLKINDNPDQKILVSEEK